MEQNDDVSFDLEEAVKSNTFFRRVLSTSKFMQLVAMSLDKNGIGREVHPHNDQFIKVEEGWIRVTLDDRFEFVLGSGQSITVNAGRSHKVETVDSFGNVGAESAYAKIYTIYAPPHHPPGTLQKYDLRLI